MYTRPLRLLLPFFLCLWSLPLYASSSLEADKSAPEEKQAQLETIASPDGQGEIPIVEIAPASTEGVSHNTFREYNVGEEGIIYNNNADQDPGSSSFGPSVLARMPLFVNDRLSGAAARIILTEVSGSNLSHLRGMTEIYGSRAAYILANPNGIQVDGGGFINTNRVTLTTGASYFGTGGSLGGFRVQKGTVRILEGGLAGPPLNLGSSPIEIISRSAEISSGVWNGSPEAGGDSSVSIYTGQNTFNYKDKQVTPASVPAGTPPKLAIDASLLGHIQAGKIMLISTEEGVGVKAPRLLSHGGDITIQSRGPVSLPRSIQSNKNVSVQSGGLLSVSGERVRGSGPVHLSGDSVQISKESLVYSSSISSSSPSVLLEAVSGVTNAGQVGSKQGSVGVKSGSLTNKGKIVSESGSITLAVKETIDNASEGEIGSGKSLSITAGTVTNRGKITGGKGENTLEAGVLTNSGKVGSLGGWNITTDQLTNEGELGANKGLSLGTDTLINPGSIKGSGPVRINVTNALTQAGTISSGSSLSVKASSLENEGTIASLGDLTVKVRNALNNQGSIESQSELKLAATSVTNEGTLAGSSVALLSDTILNNKSVIGVKTISIPRAKDFTNTGTLQGDEVAMTLSERLTNEGQLRAAGALSLTAPSVHNTSSGTITGGTGENSIEVTNLENAGMINSLHDWGIKAQRVSNSGTLGANGGLSLETDTLTNPGVLGGGGAVHLTINRSLDHTGTISSASSLSLDVPSLENKGTLSSQGRLRVATTRGKLTNRGKIIGGAGQSELSAAGGLVNHSLIHSQGTLKLKSPGAIENHDTISSKEGLVIENRTGSLLNAGGLGSGGDIAIFSRSLHNASKSVLSSRGKLLLHVSEKIHSEPGAVVSSQGDMLVEGLDGNRVKELTNHVARIKSGGKMTLRATRLHNKGEKERRGDWSRVTERKKENQGLRAEEDWELTGTTYGNQAEGMTKWYVYDNYNRRHGNVRINITTVDAPFYHRRWVERYDFYLVEENRLADPQLWTEASLIRSEGDMELDVEEGVNESLIESNGTLSGHLENIKNEPLSEQVTIPDGFVYRKEWQHKEHTGVLWLGTTYSDCYRAYRAPRTITVRSANGTRMTGRAGIDLSVDNYDNSYSIDGSGTEVVHAHDQLSAMNEEQATAPFSDIALSLASGALFKQNGPTDADLAPAFDLNLLTSPQAIDLPAPARLPAPPLRYMYKTAGHLEQPRLKTSSYFLRKLGLDNEENRHSLQFLGDPFFEMKLINEKLLRQLHRSRLRADFLSDEEQVKYLIDNAAAVHQDLQLTFGVALSKEQIARLDRDIVWYVEREVNGQRVLEPELYLCQATRDGIDLSSGLVSRRGKVSLKATGRVKNIGVISGQAGVAIDAKEVHNEGAGQYQARIESNSGVTEVRATSIKNLSGGIYGARRVEIDADEVISETKVSEDGKELQAVSSIESGGDMHLKTRNLKMVSSDLKVRGDADFSISGDFTADTAQTVEEHYDEGGSRSSSGDIFSSSSSKKSWSKKSKQVTNRANNIVIGGKARGHAKGNVKLTGVNIEVDDWEMTADGKVDMRPATDSTHNEQVDTTETKESSCFGLSQDNQTKTEKHVSGSETAVGNQVRANRFIMHGKQGAEKQRLIVKGRDQERAQEFAFTSDKGDVVDHAFMAGSYDSTTTTTDTEKHGLLGFKFFDGKKGRVLSLKLSDKKHHEKEVKDDQLKAQQSSVLADEITYKSEEGKLQLEGTEMEGKNILLQGAKGVFLKDGREESTKSTRTETKHEEISLGLKNKFLEAGQEAAALVEATQAAYQASENLIAHQEEVLKAKEAHEKGLISAADYAELVAETGIHTAAVAAAGANILIQTKQFTGAVVAAGASTKTLGISLDCQADVVQLAQMVVTKRITSKSGSIKGDNVTIVSRDGNLEVDSAQVQAKNVLAIDVENIIIHGSEQREKTTTTEDNESGNVTVELGLSSSLAKMVAGSAVNAGGGKSHTDGERTKRGYRAGLLQGKQVKLNVRKDVDARGGHVIGETMEGKVGGNIYLKHRQNTIKGKSTTIGGNASLSMSGGQLLGGGGGVNYSRSRESGTGVADPKGDDNPAEVAFSSSIHSSFGATKEMKLEIGGKVIKEKPVNAHYTKRNWGVNGGVNVSMTNQGVKPSPNYGGNYSREAYRGRTLENGETEDLYQSQAGVSIDNRTIEVIANPGETVKEIKRDVVALGRMGAGVVNTFKKRKEKDAKGKHKLTVKQTWQTMGQALVNVEEQYSNSKDESIASVTEDPSSVDRDKLAEVTHGILQQNTDNPATGVDFYDSKDEKDFEKHGTGKENPANHKGNYNERDGKVRGNLGRIRLDEGGGELAQLTYTEKERRRQHKEGVDNKATGEQRTNQAYFLGDEAKKNHEAFRSVNGRGAPKRSHEEWKHANKKALQNGNVRMRATKKEDLKPFIFLPIVTHPEVAEKMNNLSEKEKKEMRSWIPIIGSCDAAKEAWEEGNKVTAAVHAVMAGTEIFIVASLLKKAGITIGKEALSVLVQQAEKRLMKAGAEQVAREGVKQVEKQALKELEKQVVKEVVAEGAKKGTKLFNFTKTAAAHMDTAGRMVPVQTLDTIIKVPMHVLKDPQGTKALMHYSQMWKNGRLYNVEVLYNKVSNTIMHFKYTQKGIGPLKAIPK